MRERRRSGIVKTRDKTDREKDRRIAKRKQLETDLET